MNSVLNKSSVQRGHESDEHRGDKVEVMRVFGQAGFGITRGEHYYCDVLAFKLGRKWPSAVAVEIERSPRNLLRNIKRDFAHGAEAILIVCPDAATLAAVARKIARHVSDPSCIAFATPLTLRLLQPLSISEHNHSEKQEKPS